MRCLRVFLRKTRAFCGKNHKNSRFFQQKLFQCLKNLVFGLQKCGCERLSWRVFDFLALAHCSLGAILGFSRVRIACLARFRLSRACALLSWHVLGFFALAHCFPGAFLGFSRLRIALLARFWVFRVCGLLAWRDFGLSSQRDALLTTFCLLAPLAFCHKALPCGKTTKIRAYSVHFHPSKVLWCGFFGKKWAFKEQLKFASKCERKL